ncbi:MAG: GAF domain-containing protein, partial [Holophagales bacterium]|nr:GAF domain-containing protein [Holophagales bacterium]
MTPPPNSEPDTTILLAGFAETSAAELASRLGHLAKVEAVEDGGALERRAAGSEVAVVCLGPELSPVQARRALAGMAAAPGSENRCHVVLAAGSRPELFQEFVDEDQLYYLSQKTPPTGDIENILESALAHQRSLSNRDEAAHRESEIARVLAIAESLARQSQPERAAASTAQAVAQITDADHGECLLYDSREETLWAPPAERGEEERRESAAAGVVSFVLRTGATVRLERVGEDPRYDPGADNDHGSPKQRFLAVQVATADRRPIAVLVARRGAQRPPFTEREETRLRLLADQISPLLGRFVVRRVYEGMDEDMAQNYRREALDHHTRGFGEQGDLLQISPAWTPWAYRSTLLAFLVALAFSVFGSIHEYASGPAVVRSEGRTELAATAGGIAVGVEVGKGDRVEAGQLLIRLF